MSNEQITIALSAAEALVLFEFVSEYTNKGILAITDQAEQRVLWNICARLESILNDPSESYEFEKAKQNCETQERA